VIALIEVAIYAVFVMPSIGDGFVVHIPGNRSDGFDITVDAVIALCLGLVITGSAAAAALWGTLVAWRRHPRALLRWFLLCLAVPYVATIILANAYRETSDSDAWGVKLIIDLAPAIAVVLALLSNFPVFRELRRTGPHSVPAEGTER
jgi:hypothetical protein